MTNRLTLYCFLSAAFYGGLLFFLSTHNGNIVAAVIPTTQATIAVEHDYDAFPINDFSFATLLDQEYFVNVFGRAIVLFEIDPHDVEINDVPVPTLALLFPFAMFLLLARGPWLIEKAYNSMAFPVF